MPRFVPLFTPGRRLSWALLVSGLLGLRIGIDFADWQVAVEASQTVAKLVEYPPGNPFYVYNTKLWTLLHQIGALLLRAGLSEITLSTIVSGLMGMLTFLGWTAVIFAFSRDSLLAIGAPFVIFVSRAAEYGVVYPILLMGTTHTYGVVGLGAFVLAVGLLGADRAKAGACLFALAPAIHPSIGVWLWVIVGIAALWDRRTAVALLLRARWAFVLGCAVTALSLIAHLTLTYDAPAAPPDVAERYLPQFVSFWDGHRRPVDVTSGGVLLNVGALALGLMCLTRLRANLPQPSLFLVRVLVVSAAISLGFAALSWIPPDRVPASFLILMPSRLLNVNALLYAAVLFGLLGACRERPWSAVLTIALSLGLLAGDRSAVWDWVGARPFSLDPLIVLGLATAVFLVLTGPVRRPDAASAAPVRAGRMAMLALYALALLLTLRLSSERAALKPAIFRDRTNEGVFAAAARRDGMLLTAGDFFLIQLRTRRPVLFDGGALDLLPYTLEAAPEIDRILREVYGLDLFDPPEDARWSGRVPPKATRRAWEAYSLQKWRTIRQDYGVTQVLTPADWLLDLPPAAQNRDFLLYDIR